MMDDLNDAAGRHARGEDTTDQFAEFMDKHGEFFPENPQDVDELIDALARRQAAAERLMRSLSPRAARGAGRADAAGAAATDLESRDGRARRQPAGAAARDEPGRQPADIDGDEPLGYGEAVGAVAELADLEALESQLGQDVRPARPGRRRRRGGGAAARRGRRPTTSRRCGSSSASWSGRATSASDADGLTLTPKALRRLGETRAATVFAAPRRRRPRRPRRPARRAARTSSPARPGRGSSATSSRSTWSGRSERGAAPGRRGMPAAVSAASARGRGLRGGRDRAARRRRGRAAASTCRSR